MKRKLLRQISNEWRSNFWLAVELMIVSIAVWYMATQIYIYQAIYHMPNGYETDNCYVMSILAVPGESPSHEELDSTVYDQAHIDHFGRLVKRVGELTGVETVAFGRNNVPYNYNFSGWSIRFPEDTLFAVGNTRHASPDMAVLMHYTPIAGATTREELRDKLAAGEALVSRSIGRGFMGIDGTLEDGLEGAKGLIGKTANIGYDDYKIGAVIEDQRRGYYEPAGRGTIILPLRPGTKDIYSSDEILVRIRPGADKEFVKAFDEAVKAGELSTSLYYVPELKKIDDIAYAHHLSNNLEQRNLTIIMLFLMVSVFLGLLGTFWFRTSKRTSEIAVRMSSGATRGDIFKRLIGEGMLLLVGATIPAAVIDWAVAWYIIDFPNQIGQMWEPWGFLATGVGIAFVLMAVMTIAGVWLPARRAMSIDPATALHAE